MAESQPLDELRLALMQDVLPMGLAFVDRVRSEDRLALWSHWLKLMI